MQMLHLRLIYRPKALRHFVRVLILGSGGKDSSYAIWWAMLRGWDVAGIVTVQITGSDSMTFQLPTTSIAGLQAASAKIPWLPIPITGNPDSEMGDLKNALEGIIQGSSKQRSEIWSSSEKSEAMWPETWPWPDDLNRLRPREPIDAIVVGALRSDYQKTRVERMCQELGVISYTPIWHNDSHQHMVDLIEHGFSIMMTSITTDGLGKEWVGKILTDESFRKLSKLADDFRFNVDGEGGEYETAVLSAPWMDREIATKFTAHWTGMRGWADIWSAELI